MTAIYPLSFCIAGIDLLMKHPLQRQHFIIVPQKVVVVCVCAVACANTVLIDIDKQCRVPRPRGVVYNDAAHATEAEAV